MLAGFFYFGCWLLQMVQLPKYQMPEIACAFSAAHSLKTYRLVQFRKSKTYRLVQFGIVIRWKGVFLRQIKIGGLLKCATATRCRNLTHISTGWRKYFVRVCYAHLKTTILTLKHGLVWQKRDLSLASAEGNKEGVSPPNPIRQFNYSPRIVKLQFASRCDPAG